MIMELGAGAACNNAVISETQKYIGNYYSNVRDHESLKKNLPFHARRARIQCRLPANSTVGIKINSSQHCMKDITFSNRFETLLKV